MYVNFCGCNEPLFQQMNLLFFIHYNSYFSNLFHTARSMKKFGHKPVCVFVSGYSHINEDIALCIANDIQAIDDQGNEIRSWSGDLGEKPRKIVKPQHPVTAFFKGTYRDFRTFFRQFSYWRKRIRSLEDLAIKTKAQCLFLGGDIAGTDTSAVIQAGKNLNIPSIAVVNWLGNFEAINMYYLNPEHHLNSLFNIAASICFPQWSTCYNKRRILKLPGANIFAAELAGLGHKSPWLLHSGKVSGIAVEGEKMKKDAVAMGLNAAMVHATGTIQNDLMFELIQNRLKNRDELLSSLGLPTNRQTIVTAIPPDMLKRRDNSAQVECDFSVFNDLVEFWISSLTDLGCNVVVSLHPSLSRCHFSFIEREGVRICSREVSTLIPLSDIYVASISATINWAIACGIPVVNYDVYRFAYKDYVDARAVLPTQDKSEFRALLARITSDENFLKYVSREQTEVSTSWARLDGKSAERIDRLITDLHHTKVSHES